MLGVKFLRISLALLLALSTLALTGSGIAGDRLVDQTAKIDLMAKMGAPVGTAGTAELRLRIDEAKMLELFRVKADAEGLVAGGTYTLWVVKDMDHKINVASAIADANGKASWDVSLDTLPFGIYSLLGLKVKITYGDKVVLFGKVLEIEDELEVN